MPTSLVRVGIRLHVHCRALDAQSVNYNMSCTFAADTALTQSASQSSRSANTSSWQCPTPTPQMARESPYLATQPLPLSAPPSGCQCGECLAAAQSILAQNDSGFTSGQSSDHRSAHVFPLLPPTDEQPAEHAALPPDAGLHSSGETNALTSSGRYQDEDCMPSSMLPMPADNAPLAAPTASRAVPQPPQRNASLAKNDRCGDALQIPLPPEMPTPLTCIRMEQSFHEAAGGERISDRASERSAARRTQASASGEALDSKASSKKLTRASDQATARDFPQPSPSLDSTTGTSATACNHSSDCSERLETDSFEYRDMGLV